MQRNKNLNNIPEDLATKTLTWVPVLEICESAVVVSKTGLFGVCKNDVFWKTFYRALFGEERFPSDYKEQCIAEYLLMKASIPHADQAHYYFNKLKEFLEPYRAKPWANYFLGRVYSANRRDAFDAGLEYFMQGVRLDDVRAAQFLVSSIYNAEDDDQRMAVDIIDRDGVLIFNCLNKAVNKGYKSAMPELSFLWAQGIGTPLNTKKAFDLLLESLKLGLIDEAGFQILFVFIDPQDESMTDVNRITCLETLFDSSSPPNARFACALGLVLQDEENTDQALFWFTMANMLGNAHAAYAIAHYCQFEDEARQNTPEIRDLYALAFERGSRLAGLVRARCLFETGVEDKKREAVELNKKCFFAGETDAASALSAIFREEKGWEENPRNVWWVQTAALCGDIASRKALRAAAINSFPYGQCARAMLFELGSPGILKAFHSQHEDALRNISGVRKESLSNYLKAGKEEGLLDRYLERIFLRLVNEAKPLVAEQPRARS